MERRNSTIYDDNENPLAVYTNPGNGQINVLTLSGSPLASIYDHGDEITISLKPYQVHPSKEIPGFDYLMKQWDSYCNRGAGDGAQALALIGRALTFDPQEQTEKAHA